MPRHFNDHVELRTGGCMNAPVLSPVAGGEAAVFSCRAPDPDDKSANLAENQDGCLLVRVDGRCGVLAVADGLGGRPGGGRASDAALRALVSALGQDARKQRDAAARSANGNGEASLRDRILDGFELADRAVGTIGLGAATTLAVVEIDGQTIRPYHTGDSMILVIGGGGRLKLQTVQHSPVGYAVESGLLEERAAMHHLERHVVSNLIGAEGMRIEIGSAMELAARDTVVLASDGLFDNLHVDEIAECIRSGPLEAGAGALLEMARRRMCEPRDGEPCKPDDLTFIAYRPANGDREEA